MKKKIIVVGIIFVLIMVVSGLLNHRSQEEQEKEALSVQVDISAVNSEKYFNQFKIKAALEKYAKEHQLDCKNAIALDYKYEDLESAEQIYDIYFLLDDKKNTLVTVCYHPQLNGVGLEVKARECEYTLDEIKSQAWYKEDYQ